MDSNDNIIHFTFSVSIKSSRAPFKGFAIVAADPSSSYNDETYMGQFEVTIGFFRAKMIMPIFERLRIVI